jgi:hypothetical protein
VRLSSAPAITDEVVRKYLDLLRDPDDGRDARGKAGDSLAPSAAKA